MLKKILALGIILWSIEGSAAQSLDDILKFMPPGCWVNDPSLGVVSIMKKDDTNEIYASAIVGKVTYRIVNGDGRIDVFEKHEENFVVKDNTSVKFEFNHSEMLNFIQLEDKKVYAFNRSPELPPFSPGSTDYYLATVNTTGTEILFMNLDPGATVKEVVYHKESSGFRIDAHIDGLPFHYSGKLHYELHLIPGEGCDF